MTRLDPQIREAAGAAALRPQGREELPYLLTTADVAALLRCDLFVRTGTDDGAQRERQVLAMARRWLKKQAVPAIRAGKHRLFRRDAVLQALAAAEISGNA